MNKKENNKPIYTIYLSIYEFVIFKIYRSIDRRSDRIEASRVELYISSIYLSK